MLQTITQNWGWTVIGVQAKVRGIRIAFRYARLMKYHNQNRVISLKIGTKDPQIKHYSYES